eukprot:gene43832-54467_t
MSIDFDRNLANVAYSDDDESLILHERAIERFLAPDGDQHVDHSHSVDPDNHSLILDGHGDAHGANNNTSSPAVDLLMACGSVTASIRQRLPHVLTIAESGCSTGALFLQRLDSRPSSIVSQWLFWSDPLHRSLAFCAHAARLLRSRDRQSASRVNPLPNYSTPSQWMCSPLTTSVPVYVLLSVQEAPNRLSAAQPFAFRTVLGYPSPRFHIGASRHRARQSCNRRAAAASPAQHAAFARQCDVTASQSALNPLACCGTPRTPAVLDRLTRVILVSSAPSLPSCVHAARLLRSRNRQSGDRPAGTMLPRQLSVLSHIVTRLDSIAKHPTVSLRLNRSHSVRYWAIHRLVPTSAPRDIGLASHAIVVLLLPHQL